MTNKVGLTDCYMLGKFDFISSWMYIQDASFTYIWCLKSFYILLCFVKKSFYSSIVNKLTNIAIHFFRYEEVYRNVKSYGDQNKWADPMKTVFTFNLEATVSH